MMLILLLSFLSFSLADRNPQIVRITENQVRNLGGSIELSCSVLYSGSYSVLWMKSDPERFNDPLTISSGSTLLISDSRISLRYDQSSTTYTLQIRDVQRADAGVYQCVILMSPNNYISKETKLAVYTPPIIYENSSSTVIVSEFIPVILECYAGGIPKPLISWKRENGAILPTGGTVYRGNVLKINSIKKEDRGTYYCIADNKVGESVKKSIAVEVEFPPKVHSGKEWVQQARNFDADLECRVEAFPTPTITWEKDGHVVTTSHHRYQVTPTTPIGQYRDSSLRVVSTKPDQFGTYLCKAVNRLGESMATIHLEEVDDPVCPPACGSGHYSIGNVFLPNPSVFCFTIVLGIIKFL